MKQFSLSPSYWNKLAALCCHSPHLVPVGCVAAFALALGDKPFLGILCGLSCCFLHEWIEGVCLNYCEEKATGYR